MRKNTIARIENNLVLNGKYQLTAKEQKVVLFLISNINPVSQLGFQPQVISIKEMGSLLLEKARGSFYKEINEFIERLMTKRISFITDARFGSKRLKGHINWFSAIVGCYNEAGESSFSFSLNSELKPYLLDLKEYAQIDYLEVLPLKSSFSIRMYQIFKAHRSKMSKFQHKSKLKYQVEALKELLEVEDKYKDYRNFRLKVLNTIEREINKHTSLSLKYTPIKDGRKIAAIQFEFWESGAKSASTSGAKKLSQNTLTFAEERAFNKLVDFGVNNGVALEMLSKVKGSEIGGFEDWYFEDVMVIFESKTNQASDDAKAGTLVIWFLKKKIFEQGDQFAKIMEALVARKKKLQKENPEKWGNRQVAKHMTAEAFRKYINKNK